jgi:hypothetical protein
MKNILLILFAFILGFGGIVGYQYFRTKQNTPVVVAPAVQPTPEPTFALVPPSQAVAGTLTVTSGHAQKLSREDSEYKEASTGAQILLGESVATKENSSATATVSGIVKVSMGPNAELVFANLFPTNMVLQQKSGNIDYLVTKPISIRTLHSLAIIDSGETIVTIIDTDISITVKTGSVKFALVDTDNNTKVWDLKAGQRANIDDVARKVYLVP